MAFPAKTWAKIKADYETGNYTYAELGKKYEISHTSIETRSVKESWNKAALKPAIEKAAQEKTISAAAKLGITPEKVLKELALVGFADMADFIDVSEGGEVRAKPLDELKKNVSRVIKKIREKRVIRQTKDNQDDIVLDDTFEFELHDKMNALEKLGKHLGLFADTDISINLPNPPDKLEIVLRHASN